jgi:hypothetical protein
VMNRGSRILGRITRFAHLALVSAKESSGVTHSPIGLASRVGFEPTTKGLKVPCSATELPARGDRITFI